MRAVAVSLVLVFHLAPSGLTGGYVGVDVFFVISGFLITSHLLARPPRRPADFVAFWGRRVRRLLPASLVVLAATLVASRLVAPATQWASTAEQARAAALYVVNWVLAGDAVDYLASDNAPTPVQHFWSLSVEEQFYLVWPLLIGLFVALGRGRRRFVLVGLTVVVVASLVYSVWLTGDDPARAYFVTPTRIWELGAGGLLAALVAGRGWTAAPWRGPAALLGLALIAIAALTFDAATPFPGVAAALPVLGSVLVLGAQADPNGWLGRALGWRPVQWVGDASYAVYLWHWPIIVLLPAVSGRLGTLDRIVVVVLTLVLAELTKRYVEDPFRSRTWQLRVRRTYVLGAVGMAVVVTLGTLQIAESHQRVDDARQAVAARLQEPCFGAGSLAPGADCRPDRRAPVPAPVLAAEDKSAAYEDVGGRDCWAGPPRFVDTRCRFGAGDASVKVALVGNSHAGQWLPALQEIGADEGWRVDTYLASQCALADLRQQFATDAHARACRAWVQRTASAIRAGGYDLVVMSNRISVPARGRSIAASQEPYERGYEAVLRTWAQAGLRVVVLRDTPAPGDAGIDSIPDCVAANPDDLDRCAGARSEWVPGDPSVAAVEAVGDQRITSVDLNDRICAAERCAGVVGGAVVYFDGSHLTATYARTLVRYLRPALAGALPDGRR